MNRRFQLFTAFLTFTILIAACNVPAGNNGTPPSSNDQVATVVASTLQALTPETNNGETPGPETPTDGLLTHTFYFLGTDAAGLTQVFRLEKDGKTMQQVTSEPANVGNYGVSPVDGSVAYIVNNQLLLVNADGSDRRLVVDGGKLDENNPFLNVITNPVFSPDEQTLAYGYKGLNLYSLSAGTSSLVIEDQIDESGAFPFPKELYRPESFSPDGTKLLITLAYYEGASAAIYDPTSQGLVRLTGAEGALICCDAVEWSANGSSIYSASRTVGMFNSGLWKVDPTSGTVTTLFTSNYDMSSFNFAYEPYLAPDGQLYFFFTEAATEFNSRTPLQLVRSAADGVTGRTVVKPDTFELMNEALWAPDANFVIVAFAANPDTYQGGRAEVVYLDGRPNMVLTAFAQQMKWGP
jgi:Tol biopolymer transport system component